MEMKKMAEKQIFKVVMKDIQNIKKILYEKELILEEKGESVKKIAKNSYNITWNEKSPKSNIIYDNNIGIDFIMRELLVNRQYSILLYDRSIIQFEFIINNNEITKQRMLFIKKHNKILDKNQIISISSEQDTDFFDYFFEKPGIPTMIRIDYDKENSKDCVHPTSHLTISNNETCRIPIKSLMSCTKFVLMILNNFYNIEVESKYDNITYIEETITQKEKNMVHLNWN